MKHVKLFESWLNEGVEVSPKEIGKAFPIDTKQWGSMDFVTGKNADDMPGLATYLEKKLNELTQDLSVKFKVEFNKKDKTVEVFPVNNPKLKFITTGSLPEWRNTLAKEKNPYANTLFNYRGFIKDGDMEIIGDRGEAVASTWGDTGDWRLGEFLSATIQKKDVNDIEQSPKEFALNVALIYVSSQEGKPATIDNIVSKVTTEKKPQYGPEEVK